MSDESNQTTALLSVAIMVVGAILIVAMVLGYKDCQSDDVLMKDCLATGHHTANECRCAIKSHCQ